MPNGKQSELTDTLKILNNNLQLNTMPFVNILTLQKKITEAYTLQIMKYLEQDLPMMTGLDDEMKQRHFDNIFKLLSANTAEKKRMTKDPNAPKRPPSAFVFFKREHTKNITDLLDAEGQSSTPKFVARRAGEIWRMISDEHKTPFVEEHERLKEEYNRALLAYKKKIFSHAIEVKPNMPSIPTFLMAT